MSSGPPSYQTPPPGGITPPSTPPPRRTGFLDQFRGMQWWEIVLVILPLSLIFLGGLIGGVFGALGALSNTYIARSKMSPAVRVVLMIGVLLAAYVVFFIVEILVLAALHSAAS